MQMSEGLPKAHRFAGCIVLLPGANHALAVVRLLQSRDPRPSRSWYPPPLMRWTWPVEPVLKVCGASLGIGIELYAKDFPDLSDPTRTYWHALSYDPGLGHIVNVGLWAHATMYISFVLIGLIEILGVCFACCHPHDADSRAFAASVALAATSLGWGISAVGYAFHAADQQGVWSRSHQILALFAAGASLASAVEASAKPAGTARLAALSRVVAVLCEGVWYLHIATMLEDRQTWTSTTAMMALPVAASTLLLNVCFGLLGWFVLSMLATEFWRRRGTNSRAAPAAMRLSEAEEGVDEEAPLTPPGENEDDASVVVQRPLEETYAVELSDSGASSRTGSKQKG